MASWTERRVGRGGDGRVIMGTPPDGAVTVSLSVRLAYWLVEFARRRGVVL